MQDDRIRKLGGGRKHLTQQYPRLNDELLKLVEPQTRGDPKSALCWVAKSSRALATELEAKGIAVCHQSVCAVLSAAGYSLQANQTTLGKGIPDGVYDIQANDLTCCSIVRKLQHVKHLRHFMHRKHFLPKPTCAASATRSQSSPQACSRLRSRRRRAKSARDLALQQYQACDFPQLQSKTFRPHVLRRAVFLTQGF